jgi:Glycosyl transferase family 11
MNRKRIVLRGRLGNNLWQLAFAHRLTNLGYRTEIVFLTDELDNKKNSNTHFLMKEIIRRCNHGIQFREIKRSRLYARCFFVPETNLYKYIGRFLSPIKYEVHQLLRDMKIADFSAHRTFLGYYQDYQSLVSEVEDVAVELDEALKNFVTNSFIQSELEKKDNKIVHFRMGDFLEPRHINAFGVLAHDYYEKIMRNEGYPQFEDFLLLTDDRDGVNRHMPATQASHVFGPGDFNETEALFILSRARILLMSNSSFCWWGALLASRNGATVHSPFPWRKSISDIKEPKDSRIYFPSWKIEKSVFL